MRPIFKRPTGTGNIAQNIRELQDAVKSITPKPSPTVVPNIRMDGTTYKATGKSTTGGGGTTNVVCRWL